MLDRLGERAGCSHVIYTLHQLELLKKTGDASVIQASSKFHPASDACRLLNQLNYYRRIPAESGISLLYLPASSPNTQGININIPPQLDRHDSDESFAMFSVSTDS